MHPPRVRKEEKRREGCEELRTKGAGQGKRNAFPHPQITKSRTEESPKSEMVACGEFVDIYPQGIRFDGIRTRFGRMAFLL